MFKGKSSGQPLENTQKTFGQGSSGKETRVMILLDSGDRWDLREEDPMFCELFFSAPKQALVGFFPCDVFPQLAGEGL
jgi:hypothetical protein